MKKFLLFFSLLSLLMPCEVKGDTLGDSISLSKILNSRSDDFDADEAYEEIITTMTNLRAYAESLLEEVSVKAPDFYEEALEYYKELNLTLENSESQITSIYEENSFNEDFYQDCMAQLERMQIMIDNLYNAALEGQEELNLKYYNYDLVNLDYLTTTFEEAKKQITKWGMMDFIESEPIYEQVTTELNLLSASVRNQWQYVQDNGGRYNPQVSTTDVERVMSLIQEMLEMCDGTNSVDALETSSSEAFSVYSMEGILIKKDCKVEDLKSLPKGIYVIVSGKARYKISI